MRKPKSARHVRAGQARHRRLREQAGEDGYRQFQQAGYAAMLRKYGESWAKACLAKAHESRRRWRIANPTPGEAAVTLALTAAGYSVHADPDQPFEYQVWQANGAAGSTADDAIREAKIGPYYADILLPMQALVLEIVGGVHCLTEARDRQRRQWLEAQGLRVIIIDEATAITPRALAGVLSEVLGGGAVTPADAIVWSVWRRIAILDIRRLGASHDSCWTYPCRLYCDPCDWQINHRPRYI